MFKIVDRYILRTFLPLFAMSFGVCWFIVVMQFLWRYTEELVGKGLSFWILAKVIFYAAMSFIPMALPLGILLATLMTLGNMGERLELLALKASGIRLYRIIRPLFVLVTLMSVGLFFFQNNLMIKAQVRMWTLIFTAKYASPEMEIKPGVFYTGIDGFSLYARERDPETGRLHQLMVYDMSRGYLNPRIIRADSGRLVMDQSKKFLILKLYRGQSFENLQSSISNTSSEPVPYMLPRFDYSETFIPVDADLKMEKEESFGAIYISKNLEQLQKSIDSTTIILDSARTSYGQMVRMEAISSHYQTVPYYYEDSTSAAKRLRELSALPQRYTGQEKDAKERLELSARDSLQAISSALDKVGMKVMQLEADADRDKDIFYLYRTFNQEWHRKFTASVSCLIFCLIGASLGAIVRRGGIGMPIIISVFFFIIYFIIDSFGINMLRSEVLPIWLGMWLSNIVLAPVGLFLAYKANQDSAALNIDGYVSFFRRLVGYRGVRKVEYQDIVIQEVNYSEALQRVEQTQQHCSALLDSPLMTARPWLLWSVGAEQSRLNELSRELDELAEELRHTSVRLIVSKLGDLPLLSHNLSRFLPRNRIAGLVMGCILPLSVPLTLFFIRVRSHLRADLVTAQQALSQINEYIHEYKSEELHREPTAPEEDSTDK